MRKMYAAFAVLALFCLAGAVPAAGQKSFRPGYVVLPGGDTLRGEVDARGQQRMTRGCLFRPADGAAPTRYAPADLKAYGVRGGARYVACRLPLPIGVEVPGVLAAPSLLFLQVLAQGRAMLYTYADENDQARYYLGQGGQPLIELVQTTRIIQTDQAPIQERTFPFRQVLSQAFGDCAAVQPLVLKAELADSQLTAIFDRYNACAQDGRAPSWSAARISRARFGLILGAQMANSALKDKGDVTLRSRLRPLLGVGLLVNPAMFNRKVAVRIEALYYAQLHEAEYRRNNGVVTTLNSDCRASVSLKTVRVPLLLRYTVPLGKLKPYIQAGVETAVLLNPKEALIVEKNQDLGGGNSAVTRQIDMRGLGIGPMAALGMTVGATGALQFEARYNQLDSASETYGQLGGANTVSFLLGYQLGK